MHSKMVCSRGLRLARCAKMPSTDCDVNVTKTDLLIIKIYMHIEGGMLAY